MRPLAAAGPDTRPTLKKPARELRQGGSDYRCCIPALAGFVSPQSIAPDGEQIFSQESPHATANSEAFDSENRRTVPGVSTTRESGGSEFRVYAACRALCFPPEGGTP